jgi:hypothetical protein
MINASLCSVGVTKGSRRAMVLIQHWAGLEREHMDEEIQEAAQELVDFFNEDMQLIPKTNIDECLSGVKRWVQAFNRDAEALEEYHKRWTKLAKLMAAQDKLPK